MAEKKKKDTPLDIRLRLSKLALVVWKIILKLSPVQISIYVNKNLLAWFYQSDQFVQSSTWHVIGTETCSSCYAVVRI